MRTRAMHHHAGGPGRPGNTLEIWNAGGDELYVYTTNWRFMRELRRRFGAGAEYIRNGYTLAWQFKIPKRFVAFLKKTFNRMEHPPVAAPDGGRPGSARPA